MLLLVHRCVGAETIKTILTGALAEAAAIMFPRRLPEKLPVVSMYRTVSPRNAVIAASCRHICKKDALDTTTECPMLWQLPPEAQSANDLQAT